MTPAQRVIAFGEKGSIEIEIPFNAPPDKPCRLWVNGVEELIPAADQYTLQGDLFSQAVLGKGLVPVPIDDSLKTMAIIEAIVESSATGRWIEL